MKTTENAFEQSVPSKSTCSVAVLCSYVKSLGDLYTGSEPLPFEKVLEEANDYVGGLTERNVE